MHLTGGILRHFRAFSTPEQNPALEVLSTSAHPQVTQAVGRPLAQQKETRSGQVSFGHSFSLSALRRCGVQPTPRVTASVLACIRTARGCQVIHDVYDVFGLSGRLAQPVFGSRRTMLPSPRPAHRWPRRLRAGWLPHVQAGRPRDACPAQCHARTAPAPVRGWRSHWLPFGRSGIVGVRRPVRTIGRFWRFSCPQCSRLYCFLQYAVSALYEERHVF